jgi:hypothetical protein
MKSRHSNIRDEFQTLEYPQENLDTPIFAMISRYFDVRDEI